MTNKESGKKAVQSDQWIEDSLRAHLESQADNLDFNVSSKLSAARHRALAQEHSSEHKQTSVSWFNWTNTLGSTAVVALAIFVGTQFYPMSTSQNNGLIGETTPTNQVAQQSLMEDLNLLSASDDIEFYQNVEFLEWMASNSG